MENKCLECGCDMKYAPETDIKVEEKMCGEMVAGHVGKKDGHVCFNKKPCAIHTPPHSDEWEKEVDSWRFDFSDNGVAGMFLNQEHTICVTNPQELIKNTIRTQISKAEQRGYEKGYHKALDNKYGLAMDTIIKTSKKLSRTSTIKEIREAIKKLDTQKFLDKKCVVGDFVKVADVINYLDTLE